MDVLNEKSNYRNGEWMGFHMGDRIEFLIKKRNRLQRAFLIFLSILH